MTERKFYERQPDVLPLTLPVGTLASSGDDRATAELRLRGTPSGDLAYWGRWNGESADSYYRPRDICWPSVPLPEPADRPIQAGDWVECIGDYPVRAEVKQGCRYRVAFTEINSFGEPCLRVSPVGLRISTAMFKRVDGPHVETMTQLEKTVRAQLYGVDPGHSERGVVSRVTMAGGKIVAVEPVPPSGVGEATKRDPYTEHRLRVEELADSWRYRDLQAMQRLAAWERAEKPRVTNRAERKQLAAGHPNGWPSNEGEE